MNKEKKEKQQQKREHDKFNNVTQKKEVENQNQGYNVRAEAIGNVNQKR